MFSDYQKLFSKLPTRLRLSWAIILPLSLLAAALESLSVFLIFHTVQYLRDPASFELPEWLSFIPDSSFKGLAISLIIIFVIKNSLLIMFWVYRNHLAARTQSFLSQQLLDNYLHEEYLFHLQTNSSALIRNIVDSVDSVCLLGLNGFFTFINYTLIAIAISSMLITISSLTGLLVMLFAAVLVTTIYLISRAYLKKLSIVTEQAKSQRLKTLAQLFSSIRELLISGKQNYWNNHFMHQQNAYTYGYSKGMSITSATSLSMEILLIVALMIMASVFMASGEQQADLLLPLLGAYAYAVARLIPIISGISLNLGMMQFAQEPLRNVLEPLHTEKELGDTDNISEQQSQRIDVSKLEFTYLGKSQPILKNIDFSIKPGESIGVIGPSGSGKSTLMLLLMGLLKDYEGHISVCGKDLQTVVHGWQQLIAYVPQEVTLIDDSIKANIAFGEADIDQGRLLHVIKQSHLDDLINSLDEGIETIVGERGMQLSGGQRQRLAIARALYRQPVFLFLDEATSSLDIETEGIITQTLKELHGQLTIILIAHRSSTVQHCDRLFTINGGSVTVKDNSS